MLIYYHELSLEEGFQILSQDKEQRLVHGRRVSGCSGWKLFRTLQGQLIQCWECGCTADRWIADKGRNDLVGPPVLNLYGVRDQQVVLINRDHIIPKSLGGVDSVQNLRPACEVCNSNRGNQITPEEVKFWKENQHLISTARLENGKKKALRAAEKLSYVLAPFQAIDEL
jgi:hypothetical protein